MAFMGAIPTNPVSRAGALDSRASRARAVKAAERSGSGGGSGREQDEAVLTSVEAVDIERPVTGPSANDTEDGHEDRAQHGAYAPDPRTAAKGRSHPQRPRLDLQG